MNDLSDSSALNASEVMAEDIYGDVASGQRVKGKQVSEGSLLPKGVQYIAVSLRCLGGGKGAVSEVQTLHPSESEVKRLLLLALWHCNIYDTQS